MAEIESEGELTRSEIAAFFREFADELDARAHDGSHERTAETREEGRAAQQRAAETGEVDRTAGDVVRDRSDEDVTGESDHPERMTIVVGGDSATLTLPETMEFEVEVASRSPLLSSGITQSIEFDLAWEVEEMPDDESMEVM